jgi:6-phosphogluconolactonase
MNPTTEVFADADRLAVRAAEEFVLRAGEAIAARGRFRVALAGGSTPEQTYALLAKAPFRDQIAWSSVDVFFGDERLVPPTDSRSNFGMAQRSLLVHVPEAREFPIPTNRSPADCAAAYAQTLATVFGTDGSPPRFDLIFLGLGDDGHTASLFPGAAALSEDKAWVTWSPPGTLPPPVDRVTLTYPVLNAARAVMFLVAGANKAEALHDVLAGAPKERRPAAGIQPVEGTLTFLLDMAAGG